MAKEGRTQKFRVSDRFKFIGGDCVAKQISATRYDIATPGRILDSEGERTIAENCFKKTFGARKAGRTIAIAERLR